MTGAPAPDRLLHPLAATYQAIQRASMDATGDSLDDAHAEAVAFAVLEALRPHHAALAALSQAEADARL